MGVVNLICWVRGQWPKIWRFALFGLVLTSVGSILLSVLVDYWHINKLCAGFIDMALTTPIAFELHRRFVWNVVLGASSWGRRFGEYIVTRVSAYVTNFVTYACLCFITGYYLVAFWIAAMTAGVLSFLVFDTKVFRARDLVTVASKE